MRDAFKRPLDTYPDHDRRCQTTASGELALSYVMHGRYSSEEENMLIDTVRSGDGDYLVDWDLVRRIIRS